jgi:hypothetical protein
LLGFPDVQSDRERLIEDQLHDIQAELRLVRQQLINIKQVNRLGTVFERPTLSERGDRPNPFAIPLPKTTAWVDR